MQNFQDECEAKMKVLEEAQGSAGKMSCHNEADDKVQSLKVKNRLTILFICSMIMLNICYRNTNMNVRALVPVAHEQKLSHIDFDF